MERADDYCDLWVTRRVRARKHHWCCACAEQIRPADRYQYTRSLYDGVWSRYKHCARCWAIWSALRELAPYHAGPAIRLDCDCDPLPPDHELSWLAFALPGDKELTHALGR
jgi:hypothetical protein